jgi:hypothetical protein
MQKSKSDKGRPLWYVEDRRESLPFSLGNDLGHHKLVCIEKSQMVFIVLNNIRANELIASCSRRGLSF